MRSKGLRDAKKRDAESGRRGDAATKKELLRPRTAFSPRPRIPASPRLSSSRLRVSASQGFTLIELVITLTILAILTIGVIPLVKISVKRQREQQLRETLRQMRTAIDQFHREAMLAPGAAAATQQQQQQQQVQQQAQQQQQQQQQVYIDPRVKVYITDTKIFTVDNPDRYPPDLETLVTGVNVMPLASLAGMGGRGDKNVNATDVGKAEAASEKTKIYLRSIPIDPMTGKADWCLHSSYATSDSKTCEDSAVNVFDVTSRSDATALNGEKYSDW
ncbi:MAG: type II secretion system protein [Pyrinomonadaceae bacterium]